jgi:protein-tyrosine phosphatase
MRNLIVEGSYNVRDLGGYATADGHHTRWKVLIRAGNLDKVSAAGCQYLTDYGVKIVIDLRDEWEVEDFPNVFAQVEQVRYVHIPLIGDQLLRDEAWKLTSEKFSRLDEFYIYYLEHCQRQIAQIMGVFAESSGGTVFHCYAGKDRTGLIAALVLGAVGVSIDDIADDYAQTSQHIPHLVAQWRDYAVKNGHDMQHFERDAGSIPDTMMNTLHYLTERYGGIREYLVSCGVTDGQLAELRGRFVEAD